jgi:hypothetical protein
MHFLDHAESLFDRAKHIAENISLFRFEFYDEVVD